MWLGCFQIMSANKDSAALAASIKYVDIKLDVVFSILDFYERRGIAEQRVMGTLLGTHDAGGVIEVTKKLFIFIIATSATNRSRLHRFSPI